MREYKKKPMIIKEALEIFFKEHKKKGESAQTKIIDHWKEIMPVKAEEYTQPITIKNKTLVILVSNSAWLHQLTLEKKEILERILNIIKNKEIIDIRFKIGKLN